MDRIWRQRFNDVLQQDVSPGRAVWRPARLEGWTEYLGLPRLSQSRATTADFPRIVANARGSSMKTNPIKLSDTEIERILARRL